MTKIFRLSCSWVCSLVCCLGVLVCGGMAQAQTPKASIANTQCSALLSAHALSASHTPFQKGILRLLPDFERLSFSINWSDRTGQWLEISKLLRPESLPVIAPEPERGASFLMMTNGYAKGIPDLMVDVQKFKIAPVRANGNLTLFALNTHIAAANISEPTQAAFKALQIYTALSVALYAQFLVIEINAEMDPEKLRDPQADRRLFNQVGRLRAAGQTPDQIAAQLDLPQTRFIEKYFRYPLKTMVIKTRNAKNPNAEPENFETDSYHLRLYYELPNYIQWLSDNGKTAEEKVMIGLAKKLRQ